MVRLSVARVWAAYLRGSEAADLLQIGGMALVILPIIAGAWYLIADLIGTLVP